jgi:hypothetical protein
MIDPAITFAPATVLLCEFDPATRIFADPGEDKTDDSFVEPKSPAGIFASAPFWLDCTGWTPRADSVELLNQLGFDSPVSERPTQPRI